MNSFIQNRLHKAKVCLNQGEITEAEAYYREIIAMDTSPEIKLMAQDGLGRCLHLQGKSEEAAKAFTLSVELLRDIFGFAHPHVAVGLQNLAQVRSAQGRGEEAIALGKEALEILEQNLSSQPPVIAEALLNLSSCEYEAGNYDNAETHLSRALFLWEQYKGRCCMEVSTCLNNLGRIYEQREKYDIGVRYHQEAVNIRKVLLGEHPETAFSLANLGAALAGDLQWDKATEALRQAINCYERLGLETSQEAATCRKNLDLCRKAALKN